MRTSEEVSDLMSEERTTPLRVPRLSLPCRGPAVVERHFAAPVRQCSYNVQQRTLQTNSADEVAESQAGRFERLYELFHRLSWPRCCPRGAILLCLHGSVPHALRTGVCIIIIMSRASYDLTNLAASTKLFSSSLVLHNDVSKMPGCVLLLLGAHIIHAF
jgi:hypothetical protein